MASWKKVIVSGSTGVELNSLTLKGAAGTIVNESTVADSRLTGSFTGSFVGEFTNSDGTSVGSQTLDQTMALGSTTSVAITSSADNMLSGSGTILSGDVTSIGTVDATTAVLSADFDVKAAGDVTLFDTVGANNLTIGDAASTVKTTLFESATSVKSPDFDVLAAGDVTLFDSVGANNLTIGAGTSTVKTTLFESATSVKSADFDVLTAQNVTLFDTVGNNDLTIGASDTTVKIPGDLIELGNSSGDIVDIKGDLRVAGTASFSNATNLAVADKYILLNSGSSTTGDGGFVVQQATNGTGELFGYDKDSGTGGRWGVATAFNADTAADFTPAAFMAAVIPAAAANSQAAITAINTTYNKAGNIYTSTATGNDIWIYS